MRCPENEYEAMQNAVKAYLWLRTAVIGHAACEKMHQAYRIANHERLLFAMAEGGLDHNRMFYCRAWILHRMEASGLYAVRAKSYYFNDPDVYEAGDNGVVQKTKEMEFLIAGYKINWERRDKELKGDSEFETIYIKFSGRNPYGYDPRFVSNSRPISV